MSLTRSYLPPAVPVQQAINGGRGNLLVDQLFIGFFDLGNGKYSAGFCLSEKGSKKLFFFFHRQIGVFAAAGKGPAKERFFFLRPLMPDGVYGLKFVA